MTTRADHRPYSRIYWDAVDDPRFEHVWWDDHALAAWMRLLITADGTYPASPPLPRWLEDSALNLLVDAGLVAVNGQSYRIHGLDSERQRRSQTARNNANHRWHSDGSAVAMRPHSDGNAVAFSPVMLDETRRDETRRDEPRARDLPTYRDGLHNMTPAAIAVLERVSRRPWSQAGDRQLSELDRLIGDHGLPAVTAALEAVDGGKHLHARQLVWGVVKQLEPIPTSKDLAKADSDRDNRKRRDRALADTMRRREEHYRFTGEWVADWGPLPEHLAGDALVASQGGA